MYEQLLFLGRALTTRLSALKQEKGQGITEYGIAVAIVVIFLATALYLLVPAVSSFISTVGVDINNLPNSL